jgi:hypothetical protein
MGHNKTLHTEGNIPNAHRRENNIKAEKWHSGVYPKKPSPTRPEDYRALTLLNTDKTNGPNHS